MFRKLFSIIYFNYELMKYKIRVKELSNVIKAKKEELHKHLKPNTIWLDLGCGSGIHSRLLERMGLNVVSVDIAKTISFPLSNFIIANAEFLPFRTEIFKVIIVSHMLEHVRNKMKVLKEIYRVLAPDGILILVVPTIIFKLMTMLLWPRIALIRIFTSKKRVLRGLLDILRPGVHGAYNNHRQEIASYRIQSWLVLLERAGFNVIEHFSIYPDSIVLPLNPLMHYICIRHLKVSTSYLIMCIKR